MPDRTSIASRLGICAVSGLVRVLVKTSSTKWKLGIPNTRLQAMVWSCSLLRKFLLFLRYTVLPLIQMWHSFENGVLDVVYRARLAQNSRTFGSVWCSTWLKGFKFPVATKSKIIGTQKDCRGLTPHKNHRSRSHRGHVQMSNVHDYRRQRPEKKIHCMFIRLNMIPPVTWWQ